MLGWSYGREQLHLYAMAFAMYERVLRRGKGHD